MFGESFEYVLLVWDLVIIQYYGWAVFLVIFLWIGYQIWLGKQIEKFMATVPWVFLEVRVDELNEKSPIAMEQIFASMHAMIASFSLGERWTGKVPLTMSAEIVSIGGRVSFIFKLPERYRNLFESAVFAQYPKAEIRQIQDYLGNLPRNFDPDKSEFDMWGTQLNKRADNVYPIRTYKQEDEYFEQSSQKTTIEPISGVLEALSNIQPHELMTLQIVLKPINDDWKKSAEDVLAKMKGLPAKAKGPSWFEVIFFEYPGIIINELMGALGLTGEGEVKKEDKPQSLVSSMSDSEKGRIDAVVQGLNKLSFEIKFRILYLAPKDKFNKGIRIPELLGAFRNFDNPQLNGFKPDSARITTDASFKLFEKLEKPWLDYKIITRKNKFLRWFKDRDHDSGSGTTILNTEELATICHFPQAPNARVSQLERVQTVKSAPPIDLPIG
jgi:hypothetical protein